ncbi:MAG: ABC transporter ATP-binding protein [Streptosporangiales bacterium]|nr:ABC transporter ATP-binding protein [Streptosporangiales bacterium]MBO0890278.1 ABC transporter ATP-binding protein [Acidothermales bacterium]
MTNDVYLPTAVDAVADTAAATGAAVLLSGLRKRYGPTTAVDGVDLAIAPGEVVALLGPNGAGKSTTIDMMLGLTKPDAGSARVFGLGPQDAIRAGHVGAMLQIGQLLPDITVREVVALVASLHRHPLTVTEALQRAGIADLARRRAGKLSGGQMQRVRFAMAIVPDPDLVVLDEPTAGMDVESRVAFWQSMRRQAEVGKTVLFATHYLEEADEQADRVVMIRNGRVVADGSTTEIKSIVTERVIRATLPGAERAALQALPGVDRVDVHGTSVELHCTDSDAALRALLSAYADARHVEVTGADLTEAFLALTGGEDT